MIGLEQRKRNPLRWFKTARLSQKLALSLGLLIFCSNLIILTGIYSTADSSLKRMAYNQLQSQLSVSVSTISSTIEDIGSLMQTFAASSYVSNYVEGHSTDPKETLTTLNNTTETLRLLSRTNNLITDVALLKVDNEYLLRVGEPCLCQNLYQILFDNYTLAETIPQTSLCSNLLFDCCLEPQLNLFCPIYKKYSLEHHLTAIMVVGLDTSKMAQYLTSSQSTMDVQFLSPTGRALVASDSTQIGKTSEHLEEYTGVQGEINGSTDLTAYQWDKYNRWVATASISKSILFSDINRIVCMLSLLIIVCTLLAIFISAFVCRRFYAPMNQIVLRMNEVSIGNLSTKMPTYEEVDFYGVSEGFNRMTDAVQNLLSEVRRREQENTEIRLNALQSQIKPHFLYNTLDCIHWMALAEGNMEVSRTVVALSKYYRLCLSRGDDLVPLSQELEHTNEYVTLQNILFDDIVSVEYAVDPALIHIMLPKITLQPLVENAIAHGIKAEDDRKGHIQICGEARRDCVLITVEDDGVGMTPEEMQHLNETIHVIVNDGSYGVKNVHQRIHIRYGDGYGLYYRPSASGGVRVELRLPPLERGRE